jgi:hypothetical protein
MGLFGTRRTRPQVVVDDTRIETIYANQLWVIPNRWEILLDCCCIAAGEVAVAPTPVPARRLNSSTLTRQWSLLLSRYHRAKSRC